MSTASLFIVTAERLPLTNALKAFRLVATNLALALLYDPKSCRFVRFEIDGRLTGPSGADETAGRVFEARVFNDTMELRWLENPPGTGEGRATIITEREVEIEPLLRAGVWNVLKPQYDLIGTLKQTYLLWGQGTARKLAPGWSTLATPRIGALPVPIGDVGANERVLLHTVEYLAEYEHGNVAVYDERLVKLEVQRLAKGILIVNAKKQVRIKFTNAKGNAVEVAVPDAELSAPLRNLRNDAKRIQELSGKEVDLDEEKGQPKRIRPVGEEWAVSSSPPPRPQAGPRAGQGARGPAGHGSAALRDPRPLPGRPLPPPAFHNPYNFVPAPPRKNERSPFGRRGTRLP